MPKQVKKIAVARARRPTFSQADSPIAKAIDGNPNRQQGWAMSPAIGSTHWAVFESEEPVGFEGGTKLTFKLEP